MASLTLNELRELVMDREAWRAAIHGVAKSWTPLSHFHFHFHYVPEGEGRTWAGGSLQAGCLWKPEGSMNHQKYLAALPAERTTQGQEKRKATVSSHVQKGKTKMLFSSV